MRKYILIPEYRPLFAMARCYGKTHGPLDRPTPVPIDIIGGLLSQTGQDKLTVYETKILPDGSSAPPVQLTLENYKLPYDELVGRPNKVYTEPTMVAEEPEVQDPVTVAPTVIEEEEEPVPQESETVTPEESNDVMIVEDHTTEPAPTQPRMTKAERRAARRAAEAQKNN